MTSDNLYWLSGLSLAAGGLLATAGWIGFVIFDPDHQKYGNPSWLPLNFLIITGGVFMALGLPGFYARQADQTGFLGLIGFVILFIGITIPYIAVHSIETATAPNVPPRMMIWVSVGAPSLYSGAVITSIATWRAGVYLPSAGITLILAALVGLLTMVRTVPAWLRRGVLPVFFTITIVWLGILLMG